MTGRRLAFGIEIQFQNDANQFYDSVVSEIAGPFSSVFWFRGA